ncbi:RNA-dependent RNA polymerase 2 [Exaiptasia diaphana]|uniref:RNA-dependent RNA polymerase n=1 Tax=Exaiptasia diaphana TaxID=2652724 RepID=A0A913Y425_EXADI|nr:RNA-dependent RNA polymerase 2 [Exaiptasia diaphana]XP_028518955.1 RNA-dependent RNA polymerase 2 [Exaiptasia diaphana]
MAEYAYAIPDQFVTLPPPDHLQTTIYIKRVEIRENIVQRFSYERLHNSLLFDYLVQTQGSQFIDRLLTVSFKSSRNDDFNYARNILHRGVEFCGEMFYFLGHSNSQLKEKTCYLMQGSHIEIYNLLSQFYEFSKIPKIAKRAKRIGLLFSGFNKSISLPMNETEDIDDIEHDGYNFTDGCGMMSDQLSKEIQRTHRLSHQPTVVQIRYQGYKGVLLHCPELQHVKAQFRKSMKKFKIPSEEIQQRCSTLGVVEYSKPFSNAYLNTQLAMVLADNQDRSGRSYLLQLQRQFYEMLRNLLHDEELAIHYLTITGRTDLLARLRRNGFWNHRVQKDLDRIRNDELRKMLKDDDSSYGFDEEGGQERRRSKLRVLVPRARVVFGVSDPYGELEYGEVFFLPSLPETELASFHNARKVVVGRNPCYHPGDVRVLKLANVEDKFRYAHIFDCLVFPVKGKRPHPHECSGGDLDGDKYFISWDQRLVPDWETNPFKYDEQEDIDVSALLGKLLKENLCSISNKLSSFGRAHASSIFGTEEEAVERQKIEQRYEMENYFSCYENDLVCRVNAIFMRYARRYGPSCDVCVGLNKYFSDAVDMNATKSEVERELRSLEIHIRQEEQRERIMGPIQGYIGTTTRQSGGIIRERHQDEEERKTGSWLGLAVNNFLGFKEKKAPFVRGDDVWTQMEEDAEVFLQEMRSYMKP